MYNFLPVCLQVGKRVWCLKQALGSVTFTTAVSVKGFQEEDEMSQVPALPWDVPVIDSEEEVKGSRFPSFQGQSEQIE